MSLNDMRKGRLFSSASPPIPGRQAVYAVDLAFSNDFQASLRWSHYRLQGSVENREGGPSTKSDDVTLENAITIDFSFKDLALLRTLSHSFNAHFSTPGSISDSSLEATTPRKAVLVRSFHLKRESWNTVEHGVGTRGTWNWE